MGINIYNKSNKFKQYELSSNNMNSNTEFFYCSGFLFVIALSTVVLAKAACKSTEDFQLSSFAEFSKGGGKNMNPRVLFFAVFTTFSVTTFSFANVVFAQCQIDGSTGVDYVLTAYKDKGFACHKVDEIITTRKEEMKNRLELALKNESLLSVPSFLRPSPLFSRTIEFYECSDKVNQVSEFTYETTTGECHYETFRNVGRASLVELKDFPWWGENSPN